MLNFKSIKLQLIIFLCGFAIFLSVKDSDIVFLFNCLIAVFFALGLEAAISFIRNRKFLISDSAVISGLIIGFVLASDQAWWKFAIAALLAILSKYLIRFKNKHIFNPACFGIFLTIILFNAWTQWKGTYLWHILLPFGIYFSYRLKKVKIILSYILVTLILFGTQAFFKKAPFWYIVWYLSYFYIFIMIIEPKTTPINPAGKYLFGFGVAVLIFLLSEAGASFDVELFSLLIMNMAVPLLNRITLKKGGL